MMRQFELVERVKSYDPMADEDAINRAYVFTMKAHGSQMRASGDSYFSHPIEVAGILTKYKLDAASIITALLHDTIEDTETTYVELVDLFGKTIADIVQEVTDDKTLPKAERKRLQIEHAANASPQAKLVKLADKISNLRDIVNCPPVDWDATRKQKYFDWAQQVVDQIRGTNEVLEKIFDELYAKGIKLH